MTISHSGKATRKNSWVLSASFLVSCVAIVPCALSKTNDTVKIEYTVKIESGVLRGEVLSEALGLVVFRGVPYAAPPIGPLRWREPQPAKAWSDVHDARTFSAVCPQSPLIAFLSQETLPETSEDCLYLNVWTRSLPKASQASLPSPPLKPVAVFIHGGGYIGGWAHQKNYDGLAWVMEGDVVFVSLNYRLGPLGFFAHSLLSEESENGVSGNYGLLDQLAALKWIQKNIEAFGGDPNRVTIIGESAGATSVVALCASPLAEGLIHGAIAQSTYITDSNFAALRNTAYRIPSAEFQGQNYAEILGATDEGTALKDLRDIPADDLWRILGESFQPVISVGGWLLDGFAEDVFLDGNQLDIPMIIGTNRDEGSTFAALFPATTEEAFLAALKAEFGQQAHALMDHYSPSEGSLELRRSLIMGDRLFVRGTRSLLRGMTQVTSRAWQYEFARASSVFPSLGAHHSAEIPYVFGTLDKAKASKVDLALAQNMRRYWIQFVKTGSPNQEGLPRWQEYSSASDSYLILDQTISTGKALRKDPCNALDLIRDRLREQG